MYIGVGNIVGKPISASTGSDSVAFFNRVTAAGGSLTLTERNAITQLIADMKSAGIWNKVFAAYPMVGGSQASCMQNLKSSAFTGIPNNTITYASTGISDSSRNAWVDTQFNPSFFVNVNSGHLGFYSRTNILNDTYTDIGVYDDFVPTGVSFVNTSGLFGGAIGIQSVAGVYNVSVANSFGFLMANRVISSEIQAWKNGLKTVTSTNSSSLPNGNIYILSQNQNLSGTFTPTNKSPRECAFATMGDGLTDAEAIAYYTAIQTFQTALSRQV